MRQAITQVTIELEHVGLPQSNCLPWELNTFIWTCSPGFEDSNAFTNRQFEVRVVTVIALCKLTKPMTFVHDGWTLLGGDRRLCTGNDRDRKVEIGPVRW